MKKTLSTIQTIMKIGRAISIMVLVCAIIGMIGTLVGGICLFVVGEEVIEDAMNEIVAETEEGDVPVGEITFDEVMPDMETLYGIMIGAFIACVVEVIISARAQKYFKFEISEGTPFTFAGAKKLKNFGIVAIILPIVGSIITEGAIIALSIMNPDALLGDISFTSSIGTGVMALLFALVFKHGAELNEVQKQANQEKEALQKKQKQLEDRRFYY